MTQMEQTKGVMDALSISTGVAAFIGWLPAIAAILTIVWTAIRIYETKTIQNILKAEKKAKEVLETAKVAAFDIMDAAQVEAKQVLKKAEDKQNDTTR